jgi:hypothetical protein
VNGDGRVIGLLFGGGAAGADSTAIPLDLIIAKFDMMPGTQRLQLRVASATANNDVRVVPRSALEPEAVPSRVPPTVPTFVPQLEQDLGRSVVGRWYVDAYLRHAREVRELIACNRRVATIWHRSGAAQLFQTLVDIARRREARVPDTVQGRPLSEIIQQMGAVLSQYGSLELRRDLAAAPPGIPALGGLTYAEILERLGHLTLASPAA